MARLTKEESLEPLQLKTGFPVGDVILRRGQVMPKNSLIKRVGIRCTLSLEQRLEWEKCKLDPIYFIENYVKIITLDHGLKFFKLRKYQRVAVKQIIKNRNSILLFSRQNGKTQLVSAIILWFVLFNNEKTVLIAATVKQALEILDRCKRSYEELPFFVQKGVEKFNKNGILLDNGSKIFIESSNPDSIRGKSIDFLYWDEAAFTQNDEDFWTAIKPMGSSGTKSKTVISSTPNGSQGTFYGLVVGSRQNRNNFKVIEAIWSDNPDKTKKWAEKEKEDIGESKFSQEYECEFIGASNTLIPSKFLKRAQEKTITPKIQNDNLKIFESYIEGNLYIATVDPAEGCGKDYSVISVFDVTKHPYKLVAYYRSNTVNMNLFHIHVITVAKSYGECWSIIEANNTAGGIVIKSCTDSGYHTILKTGRDKRKNIVINSGKEQRYGLLMTSKVKNQGCVTLRSLIESGGLYIPAAIYIDELGTFIEKKSSYAAANGCHDDTCMTLVIFSWLSIQKWFADFTNDSSINGFYKEYQGSIIDSLAPLHQNINMNITLYDEYIYNTNRNVINNGFNVFG